VSAPSLVDYYRDDAGRRFLLGQAAILCVVAAVFWAVFGNGQVDLAISRWFFDEARHAFPLSDRWLLKTLLHDFARTASALAALTVLTATATSWLTKWPQRVHAHRHALLFASGACFAGAATVGLLKHFSAHACPWDLTIFGGTLLYRPLLGATVVTQTVQGCLPAAHPLVGYAWLSVGFALAPVARHLAWRAWAIAFALGSAAGIVQILRGAHFLSHVLWSAWIIWGVNVVLLSALVFMGKGRLSTDGVRRTAVPLDRAERPPGTS
jgi:membrane-associated PAP2 superfamily phosphatase